MPAVVTNGMTATRTKLALTDEFARNLNVPGQTRRCIRAVGRAGADELFQLQQQAVDRAELGFGKMFGVEQPVKALSPVGGRQNGPAEVSMQRWPHHARDMRDVLVDQGHHVSPRDAFIYVGR